jgi:hypothetical protein
MACSHWDSSQTKLPSAQIQRGMLDIFVPFSENLSAEIGYRFSQQDSAIAHIGISSNSVTDVRKASAYRIPLCSKPGISKSVVCVCAGRT